MEVRTHSLAEDIQQQSQRAGEKRTLYVLSKLAYACTCGIDRRGVGCKCERC